MTDWPALDRFLATEMVLDDADGSAAGVAAHLAAGGDDESFQGLLAAAGSSTS